MFRNLTGSWRLEPIKPSQHRGRHVRVTIQRTTATTQGGATVAKVSANGGRIRESARSEFRRRAGADHAIVTIVVG